MSDFYLLKAKTRNDQTTDEVIVFENQMPTVIIRLLERRGTSRVEVTRSDEKAFMRYQRMRKQEHESNGKT